MNDIIEVRYLTDDRDDEKKNELVIIKGGNGDWYVATVPEGEGTIGRGVRICTSGGAATVAPGLPAAIANAFQSIAESQGLLEEKPSSLAKYIIIIIIIIMYDGKDIRLTPFNDENEARTYFQDASANWSDSYLCKVLMGPKV